MTPCIVYPGPLTKTGYARALIRKVLAGESWATCPNWKGKKP